jgi:protein XagA
MRERSTVRLRAWRCSLPVLSGLLACLLVCKAHAGAWTLPEGYSQVIVTSSFMSGDAYFDAKGRLVPVREYTKFELTPFAEYGVTDWLTAFASPSLVTVSVEDRPNHRYSGLGYTELGARARVIGTDWSAVSVQSSVRLPGALDARDPAQIGNTEPELDLRLLAGTGFAFGGWSGFVDAQAGYRWRDGALPNEYRVDLTFGVRPMPSLLLMLQSFNVIAAGPWNGVFKNARYHKLQGSVVVDLDETWSVQVGIVGSIDARNALKERGGVLGLWARF